MGYLVNIKANIPPEERQQIVAYIETLVQSSIDEPVLRVVEHDKSKQSKDDLRRQLTRIM